MEDEQSLAGRAAGGDQAAFTLIIERYRRYIYAIAWKITLNEEDALDVTQDVFERMARHIGDWDGRGALKAWIATIAARRAMDCRRRAGRETVMEPADLALLADARGSAAESGGAAIRRKIAESERRERIMEAMESLSPQQRAIFSMRFLADLRSVEIAERLGLTKAHVRSQMSRALARLRNLLNDDKG